MSAVHVPSLWVFAGPNGAGKSSFTERYRVKGRVPIVNPDVLKIKYKITERQAGAIALAERASFLSNGHSFAVETTFSGKSEIRLIRAAQECGYKISLVFIGLKSPIQSQMRVAERVSNGGHDVPDRAIMRRYGRALENFVLAKTMAHRVLLLDNSSTNKSLLWRWEYGREKYRTPMMPNWAQKLFFPQNEQNSEPTVL